MIMGKYVDLRQIEVDDLRQLRNWRNDPDLLKLVKEYRLLNMINQYDWLKSVSGKTSKNIMFLIVDKKNIPLGVCGLCYIDWKNRSAEISLYIGRKLDKYEGHLSEALHLIIDYGFSVLNMHRLWAERWENDEILIEQFEKAGFFKEGVLRDIEYYNGRYYNFIRFSLLKEEYGGMQI